MKYVSGRVRELKVGLSSYSESKTSLTVIGNANVGGTVNAASFVGGGINTAGTSEFTNLDLSGYLNVAGISTFAGIIDSNGQIVGAATSNIVPFLYSNYSLFPSATTYHGAVAHAHNTGKLYYAHAANWIELVNKETNGTVGTGTEKYDIGITSVTNLRVAGISTYDGNLDIQSSVLITGITTIGGLVDINAGAQANTLKVEDLTDNRVVIAGTGGELEDDANLTFNGTTFNVGSAITMYQATGIISATSFFGDGSGLENTGSTLSEPSSGTQRLVTTSLTTGTMTSSGTGSELAFDYSNNHLEFTDNTKATFGTGNDLQLYHNATASYIDNNTGALYIRNNVDDDDGGNIIIQAKSGKTSAVFQDDEGVRLYYDDVEKVATTGYGVTVNGTTETQKLHVTGISTFDGNVDINGGTIDNTTIGYSIPAQGMFTNLTATLLTSLNGNVDLGSASTDTISAVGSFDTNLIPSATETKNLGNSSYKWGTLFAKSVNITGVSTFNNVDIDGDLDVDGHTELDQLNVSGITTLAGNVFIGYGGGGDEIHVGGRFASHLLTLANGGYDLGSPTEGWGNLFLTGNAGIGSLSVAGVSTFSGLIDSNAGANIAGGLVANSAQISDLTDNRIVIAGTAGELEDTSKLTFDGTTLAIVGNATFTGNVSVAGTLTSEDKTNIDSIGIVTARTGVRVDAGGLVVTSGVSTFTDAVDANGGLDVAGGLVANSAKVSDLTSGRVVYVGTLGELQDISTFTFNGSTVTAPAFSGDGSALTGITAGGVGAIGGLTVKDEGVVVGTAGSISTLDFLGATVSVIANTGAAGIATVTVTTEQNQNIQTLNVSGISTFNGNINVISNDAGSSAAPEFKLYRNSATPSNADYLGQIKFAGESSTGVERNYAKITGKILDSSNGAEDGILEFAHIKNGSQVITGRWRSDSLQLLNGTSLTVAGDVSATNFNSTSDARLKTNVQTITSPLEKLNQIDGVSFDWVTDLNPYEDESSSMGVIADTIEKVLPVLVAEHATGYKTVNYNGLIGLLIEAVKEQQVQITELKTKLDSLS